MKSPTYTDEQIINAGMQLLAENKRVSPFAIRTLMGGGNPKRIKKIWAESEHEALEGQMVREQVDLPTEFEEALHATKHSLDELAKRMYNHAQEIAESRVRETIAAARKAKESAEFEVAEAMEMVNTLDEEKQELISSLEKTWHKGEQAKADNTRLQERIETLTHQAKKESEALREAKASNAELQKSNTTLIVQKDLADKQLEETKQVAIEQNNTLERAHKALATVQLEQATTQADNTNLQTTINTFDKQTKTDQSTITDLKTLIEQLTTEKHQHDTHLAIANTKQQEANMRVKTLEAELKASRTAEEQAKRGASKLQGKLAMLQK
jgi:chromosome segregation ATPase